jgi:hypothetical protein
VGEGGAGADERRTGAELKASAEKHKTVTGEYKAGLHEKSQVSCDRSRPGSGTAGGRTPTSPPACDVDVIINQVEKRRTQNKRARGFGRRRRRLSHQVGSNRAT